MIKKPTVAILFSRGRESVTFPDGWRKHRLDETHALFSGALPPDLLPDESALEHLWRLHPTSAPDIVMYGRSVKAPRFQQAYGNDYRFSGSVARAVPVPSELQPMLAWCKNEIDARFNGVLVNWYDAEHEHRIGPHRDKTTGLVAGAPIVTISLGATRTFRMKPWRKRGVHDFTADHGTTFVMPADTNKAFTHEVPHLARDRGRRISFTVRAFA
jgi:alkylated DNA repair dioxygenase AlkB